MIITIEGRQGEGKTTLANKIGSQLVKQGKLVLVLDESPSKAEIKMAAQTRVPYTVKRPDVVIVVKHTA